MKQANTNLTIAAIMATMLFAITACDSNDGPLEKAGQSMDKAATDLGNKIEDTCEDMKKGMSAKNTDC